MIISQHKVVNKFSHLPSSLRQISLLSCALTMTSSFSPALTGSSFPLHFLLLRLEMMFTWYRTWMSPSYWEKKSILLSHQPALVKRAISEQKHKMGTNFELFPEFLLLFLKLLLLLQVHFLCFVFGFHTWEALNTNA